MAERRLGQRSKRRAELWIRHYERRRRVRRLLREAAWDILKSPNFNFTKQHIQHGNMTVNAHCIRVAECSITISEKLGISCRRREMIRGALLHDYFLYDWHKKDRINPHRLHGFFHPGTALANASREYALTPREKDIIKKHMWPLTIIPPMCREAWIDTAADKWCSFMETLRLHKGHGAVSIKREQGTDVRKAEESVAADKKRVEGKRAEIIG